MDQFPAAAKQENGLSQPVYRLPKRNELQEGPGWTTVYLMKAQKSTGTRQITALGIQDSARKFTKL
jgi:hypothetical protein